jgi:hypothetical protein
MEYALQKLRLKATYKEKGIQKPENTIPLRVWIQRGGKSGLGLANQQTLLDQNIVFPQPDGSRLCRQRCIMTF